MTMFGDQYSDGLLISSIAYILETHNSSISVSVTEIIGSDCYDLTSGKKIECNVNLAKTTKLSSLSQFDILVTKVLTIRSQKSTTQNKTSSRSHLLFQFSVEEIPNANMAFIDLAGWENPLDKPDIKETMFINSTLSELNGILVAIAQNKIPFFKSTLSKIFKPYSKEGSKIVMFYHISNITAKKGLENIKEVVAKCFRPLKQRSSSFSGRRR